MKDNKRAFWQYPWGYGEGFLIAITLMILGFFLEYITPGKGVAVPSWPVNVYIIIGLVSSMSIIHLYMKNNWVKWLSSVPAAITSISVFTILVFLMGFIPQEAEGRPDWVNQLGLTHMTHNWAYVFLSAYLLVILGFTTLKRIWPLSIKNFAFFLNHAGLFIVIASASLGSSDMWKLNMRLMKDRAIFSANDYDGNTYENIGFALKLTDFEIEEYTPQIGVYKLNSGSFSIEKGGNLLEATKGTSQQFDDWNVQVVEFYSDAVPDSAMNYIFSKTMGATTAAYIKATNSTGVTHEGWISPGSFAYPSKTIQLNNLLGVGMTQPSSKVFRSKIRAYKPKSITDYEDIILEVNKPVEVNGYTLYQTGYDERMGKYSSISNIELVYDPWLPVVYVGIFMMIAGALYLAWMGRNRKNVNQIKQ